MRYKTRFPNTFSLTRWEIAFSAWRFLSPWQFQFMVIIVIGWADPQPPPLREMTLLERPKSSSIYTLYLLPNPPFSDQKAPLLPNPNLSNSWIPMHIHHHSPFYPFSIRGFTNSPILVALKQGFLLIFVIIPKPKVICGSVLRNEGIAKVIRYGTHRLTSVQYLFHGHSRLVP